MASGHKYKRLDSLRGLAALSVGVGHAVLCVDFSQDSALQSTAVGIFNGDYAVDLFFVLSGFVLLNMVRGFSGAHYLAYLGRRFLRLYPLLWASLLIAFVAQSLIAAHAPACGNLSGWICRLITRPGSLVAAMETGIPIHDHLDPVTWTVKIEVEASIVYPLVLMIWMRGGTLARIVTMTLAVVMAFTFSNQFFLHYLFLFVAGIALNDIRIRSARQARGAIAIGLILMGICGFLLKGHSAAGDLVAGASAALLIASIAHHQCPEWLAAVLDNRAVLKLGEISYSYYLLNPIVLWVIARASARPLSRLLASGGDERAFLVAALLAVCAAFAGIIVATAADRLVGKPSIASSRAAERKILRLFGNEVRAPASSTSHESPAA